MAESEVVLTIFISVNKIVLEQKTFQTQIKTFVMNTHCHYNEKEENLNTYNSLYIIVTFE